MQPRRIAGLAAATVLLILAYVPFYYEAATQAVVRASSPT